MDSDTTNQVRLKNIEVMDCMKKLVRNKTNDSDVLLYVDSFAREYLHEKKDAKLECDPKEVDVHNSAVLILCHFVMFVNENYKVMLKEESWWSRIMEREEHKRILIAIRKLEVIADYYRVEALVKAS